MAFKLGNVKPLEEYIERLRQELNTEKTRANTISQHFALLSSTLQQDIATLSAELVHLMLFAQMSKEELAKQHIGTKIIPVLNQIKVKTGEAAKLDDAVKNQILTTLSLITNLLRFTSGKWMTDLETKGVKAFGDTAGKIPELTALFRSLNMRCQEHLGFMINTINSTVSFKGVQPADLAAAVRDKEQQLISLAKEINHQCTQTEKNLSPEQFTRLHDELKQFIGQQTAMQADVAKIRLAIIPQRVDELKQEVDRTKAALKELLKAKKQTAPAGAGAIVHLLEQDIKEYFRLGIEAYHITIEAAIKILLLMGQPVPDDAKRLINSASQQCQEAHSRYESLERNWLNRTLHPQYPRAKEYIAFAEDMVKLKGLMKKGLKLLYPYDGYERTEIKELCFRLGQIKMKERGIEKTKAVQTITSIPDKLLTFWDWMRCLSRTRNTTTDIVAYGYPYNTFFFITNEEVPLPESGDVTDVDALYAAFLEKLGIGSLSDLLPK
ncbi:MAG: hypothetical protein ABIJ21_05565 [Nanoarchaeota archaeon]